MSGTSNLRLHPWRDSVEHCLRLLETPSSPTSVVVSTRPEPIVSSIRHGQFTHQQTQTHSHQRPNGSATTATSIRSVDVCFHETDYQSGVSNKMNLVDLFEAIAQLPQLESLIVRLSPVTSSFPLSSHTHGIPPVTALTTLLASTSELRYLTLIGLPLFADDFDMNGCVEMLRIHPSLHSIVIKDCMFASQRHFDQMKSCMEHCQSVDYLNNKVMDITTLPKQEEEIIKPWYQSLLAACFFGCM